MTLQLFLEGVEACLKARVVQAPVHIALLRFLHRALVPRPRLLELTAFRQGATGGHAVGARKDDSSIRPCFDSERKHHQFRDKFRTSGICLHLLRKFRKRRLCSSLTWFRFSLSAAPGRQNVDTAKGLHTHTIIVR
jgi:hypothetical protein